METSVGTELVTSPSALGVAVAVALGLMRLLEITILAIVKKFGKGGHERVVDVSLDATLTEKINKMADRIGHVHDVVDKTDNDGIPMVYSSRSSVEATREIVMIIRNVSQTQERLAHVMERLEHKFLEHDRQDAVVQTNINNSLERLARAFDDHDRRVTESSQFQDEIASQIEKTNELLGDIRNANRDK